MNRLIFLLIVSSALMRANTSDTLRTRYAENLLSRAGDIYYANPDSSLYYSTLALEYATRHKLEVQMARAWHAQARTEVLRGDIEVALNHLKNAAAVFEKHHLPKYVAKCYGLMSTAVSKIGNNTECINMLLKAIAIYRQLNDEPGLQSALVNLANTYSNSKIREYRKALEALEESKRYIRPGDEWYYYYINAGIIYMAQKKYPLAAAQFDSCLSISRRYVMVDAEVTAITRMAEVQLAMKNYSEATHDFNKAVAMSRAEHLPLEESAALNGLMDYYESTGDYKNAFACQNRLKVISDSLFNIEKIKNINTVEARLKVSEKEKTIALQKLDMEKHAAEQEKSEKRIAALIAGALMLIVILFFTIFIYMRTKKQKQEVEVQKTRAERLNALNQKIFAVIAHDFKSPMITLNMLMDLQDKEAISREDLSAYWADIRNQITQSGQILDNLLNWARTELNLTQNSHAKANAFVIASEIIKELQYISSSKGIRIHNKIDETACLKVPPDILRIILRNLLSNAVKFSFNNSVVSIGLQNEALYVKDSGAGISEKTINKLFNGTVQSRLGTSNETGFGLGLYITHELIHKFNGKIWVEKNQPSGTVFKFVLPHYEQDQNRHH